MHRTMLPVYESASIMWTSARPGQSRKGTGVAVDATEGKRPRAAVWKGFYRAIQAAYLRVTQAFAFHV